jgi:Helicase conserved C-terminal domain
MTSDAGPGTGGSAGRPPASLADALRALDDDAVHRLLALRPDLLHPVPADLGALAARAVTASSVSRALDRLDAWTLAVAEGLAVLTEPVTTAALLAALPDASAEDIDQAVMALRDRALLWGPDHDLRLARTVAEAFGPTPAGLGPAFPARASVAALLAEPQRLADLLAEAPASARKALELLTWGPPSGRLDNAERHVDVRTARTPVEWLLAHGLLVPSGPDSVVLPREVALALRGGRLRRETPVRPPEPRLTSYQPADVDRAAAAQAFGFVRLVEGLLEGWGLDPPLVLRAGGLGVRELRRTGLALDVDDTTAGLVAETAYVAGLLAADGESPERYAPTPEYDRWLTLDTNDRWAALAAAWLTTTRVPGWVGVRDDRDKPLAALGPDLERGAAPELRRLALEELEALAPGEAADVFDVDARVAWRRPRRASRMRPELVGWTLAESERIGITGRGALSGAGRALLRRGTDAAADALAPLLPEPLDHVLLQADLTAVAPGPLESSLAAELSLMADVESTGGATVFRFTPTSIRRALDAGRSAEDVRAFLTTRSRTPVPQPLGYLVDDVARRHGIMRVGTARAYVRCDDEAVLSEVVADRRSVRLRLRRLAPTVLVAGVGVDDLLAGLREMGYAPAGESDDGVVVVRRPDVHRTGTRRRPIPVGAEPPAPSDVLLTAAVRALRAGDRAASAPRGPTVGPTMGGVLPRTPAVQTLALLRGALETERPVWIGFVDTDGGVSERVVDPVRLSGGSLTAFDHRTGELRTFPVHRITGAAVIEEDAPA